MSSYRFLFVLLTLTVFVGMSACSRPGEEAKSASSTSSPPPATAGAVSPGCPSSARLPASANIHGTIAFSGSQITIEANDSFFSPTCVAKLPNGLVTLKIHNIGSLLHNMTIPDLNIDMDVPSGQTITVQVKMGKTPLQFFCKYHRASGMLGALLPSVGGK